MANFKAPPRKPPDPLTRPTPRSHRRTPKRHATVEEMSAMLGVPLKPEWQEAHGQLPSGQRTDDDDVGGPEEVSAGGG